MEALAEANLHYGPLLNLKYIHEIYTNTSIYTYEYTKYEFNMKIVNTLHSI